MAMSETMQVIDRELFANRGSLVLKGIENKLKPAHLGEIVAIEIESGNFFMGKTHSEAGDKAKQKYPDKIFYFARIGAKAGISFR